MRHLLFFLLLLHTVLSPLAVHAQITLQTPAEVSVLERAGYDAAMQWAATHNFPTTIGLSNGSTLGIIRIEGPYPVYFTTHNKTAAELTQTTQLHQGIAGQQFEGKEMEIGIWDEGAAYEGHQELSGKVMLMEPGNISNHATHVAGTLIASGRRLEARGMAPQAQLYSFNWNFHASEMQAAARNGLLLSNHSYGRVGGWHAVTNGGAPPTWYWFGNPDVSETEDVAFGFYDRDAHLFDQTVYQNPHYLPVVSAGNERDDKGPTAGVYKALNSDGRWLNYDIATRPIAADGGTDGFDSMTSMALAKNVLTVGAVGPNSSGELRLSGFSSAGPTDDGRIKPDLMGIGESVLSSTAAGPAAYGRSSGTSMATPNVAGSLLLLQEMATRLRGQALRAATLKALVLHTAIDLGPPGPDYQHGWGLLNTAAAAAQLNAAFRREGRLQERELAPGAHWEDTLLKQQDGPLRITLGWTDPPGPAPETRNGPTLNDRTPMLVNDLDVILEHENSGVLYQPFFNDPDTPELPAQPGDNRVDPVEQIYAAAAPAGTYRLRVSHKGNLYNNDAQPFSLILEGIESTRATIQIDSAYAEAAIGNTTITWETRAENSDGQFVIERSSEEANPELTAPQSLQFATVVTIPTRGNAAAGSVYTFTDKVYLTGQYVYRILFESASTTERTLLRELSIDLPAPASFAIQSIFPNPAQAQTQAVVDLPSSADLSYAAFDLLGRAVVAPTRSTLAAGRHFLPFDTTSWPPGIYFIRVSTSNQHLVRKLIVM